MASIISRELAAKALDLTYLYDNGPKTYLTRQRVAQWLDCGGKVTQKLRSDVGWLLYKSRQTPAK